MASLGTYHVPGTGLSPGTQRRTRQPQPCLHEAEFLAWEIQPAPGGVLRRRMERREERRSARVRVLRGAAFNRGGRGRTQRQKVVSQQRPDGGKGESRGVSGDGGNS